MEAGPDRARDGLAALLVSARPSLVRELLAMRSAVDPGTGLVVLALAAGRPDLAEAPALVDELASLVGASPDLEVAAGAIEVLVGKLSGEQGRKLALAVLQCAREPRPWRSRAALVRAAGRRLTNDEIETELHVALALDGAELRHYVLSLLAPLLPRELLGHLVRVARHRPADTNRAADLATVVPHAGPDILLLILDFATRVPDSAVRTGLLAAVLAQSDRLDEGSLYPAWQSVLRALVGGGGTRDVLLSSVAGLAALAARLGGRDAVVDLARAIVDMGTWWTDWADCERDNELLRATRAAL